MASGVVRWARIDACRWILIFGGRRLGWGAGLGVGGMRPARSGAVLDEDDRALVRVLQARPRASWSELAQQVGVTAAEVEERWGALVAAGVAWLVVYPARRWWHGHQVGWVEAELPPGDPDGVVAQLTDDGTVLSVDVDVGGAGVLAAIAAVDHTTIGQALFSGRWSAPSVAYLATELHSPASRWVVADDGVVPGGGSGARARLATDDRVRAVLAALGPDPRRPDREVAAECGISPAAIGRVIRELMVTEQLAIRCDVTPAAIGRPVGMHWLLSVPPGADEQRLVEVLLSQPDVRWVASVITTPRQLPRVGRGRVGGRVLAALWLRDLEAAHRLTALVAARCPRASTVRQEVVDRSVKRLGAVLDPAGRRDGYVPLTV